MHLFFEGEEDPLFYMPQIRRIDGRRDFHSYICGGKANVIGVREYVDRNGYTSNICLFFVDRDFDDFLGTQVPVDKRTYITDGYSVENYFVSDEVVATLLSDFLNISRADPHFGAALSQLKSRRNDFHLVVRPLIAWIIAAREEGARPNLSNTKGLKGVVTFGATGSPRLLTSGFETFRRAVLGGGDGPSFSTVLKWRRQLSMAECCRWSRGKYELWVFHAQFLIVLAGLNDARKLHGGRAIRVPSIIREGRLMEVLGGRINPPASLSEFFRHWFA